MKFFFTFLMLIISTKIIQAQHDDNDHDHSKHAHGHTNPDTCKLTTGDLVFQDLDCGPLCNAIENVTQGCKGAKLSHVGIIWKNNNYVPYVIEAIGDNVHMTLFSEFIKRSLDKKGRPKILIGQLDPAHKNLIPGAILMAHALLGKPYDNYFLPNNNAYYCSEFVQLIFRQANNGVALFEQAPMTFSKKNSTSVDPAWQKYFDELHTTVPEGIVGCNPGAISRASCINILPLYGFVSGYKP
jgi:hypothetical protein